MRPLLRIIYPRIGTRIVVPFMLITALVAGIGIAIVTRLVAGNILERIDNQLIDSGQTATNGVIDIENEQLATLRLMAFTQGIPVAVENKNANRIDELLRPVAANAQVDDIIIFDHEGSGVLRLTRREDGSGVAYDSPPFPNLAEWVGVQRVIASEADRVGDKYVDVIQYESGITLYFSAPLVNDDDEIVGGISIGITGAHFANEISQIALSNIALIAPDGRLMGNTFRGIAPTLLEMTPERVTELTAASEHKNEVEEVLLEGKPYQMLYTPLVLRGNKIGLIVVALPSDFITNRINTSRDLFTLVFLGAVVFVITLGLVISRSITRPIDRLVETTRAIRSGDLSRRVNLQIPDELGELSSSFDHMTSQLLKSNEEIKQLYLAQLAATARHEAVLTNISDAVIVVDTGGEIILVNHAARALMETLRPHTFAWQQFVNICQNPTQVMQPQMHILDRQHLNILATPVLMPTQELLGYVIVFHDITSIIEAEQVKHEIIKQLSHELRTPLTAGRGYIELLQMFATPKMTDQEREFTQKSIEQLSILQQMIDQVIDVSTIIAGKMHLEIRPVNLADLIANQVNKYREQFNVRELRLSVFIQSPKLPIEGDELRISQAIEQLIRNAISYTEPAGKVEIIGKLNEACAVFSIVDSGVGIDEDELDRVFNVMYRGRAADAGTTDARGLGLGLFIAKTIVEAHGGQIKLQSRRHHGTTVRFTLPIYSNGHFTTLE